MRHTEGWSTNEIELLKCGFLQGIPRKLLSAKLGRSITAVNKALSRFQIRPVKTRTRKETRPFVQESTKKFKRTYENRGVRLIQQKSIEISVPKLLEYLRLHGYVITVCDHVINAQHGMRYMLNQRPLTLVQLLVKANSIRLDEKQPIFVLPELEKKYVFAPPHFNHENVCYF